VATFFLAEAAPRDTSPGMPEVIDFYPYTFLVGIGTEALSTVPFGIAAHYPLPSEQL